LIGYFLNINNTYLKESENVGQFLLSLKEKERRLSTTVSFKFVLKMLENEIQQKKMIR
jgi:hypothetical protein